jgi:four helix bundle protein
MFIAYEVSLEAVSCLRRIVDRIAARDASLADQLRRCGSSMPHNLAEGRRRRGKDRTYLYRCASGSAAEALAALDVAIAWGYCEPEPLAEARAVLDRLLGLLWPLTK